MVLRKVKNVKQIFVSSFLRNWISLNKIDFSLLGWRYSFHSESTIRNVMLFNCSHRQQNKCKGQISVNRDSLQVVGHKLHDFDTNPDIEATLQEIDEKELLAGFK